MNEIAWNKYNEEAIKAEQLFSTVNALMEHYPESMRISKAVLNGLITVDEARIIRKFFT